MSLIIKNIIWPLYSLYGGFRFVNEDLFLRKKESNKRPVLYTDLFSSFIVGTMCYGLPGLNLWSLPNEMYRLEVNLRNMKEEKNTNRYNRTFFDSYRYD